VLVVVSRAVSFDLVWVGINGWCVCVCVRVCSGGGVRAEQAARDRGRAGGAAAGR
jgi:hypothetical protein